DKWSHIDATKLGANPTLPVDPNGGANTAALLKNAVDVKQTDGTHYSGTVDLTGGNASTPLGQPDIDRLGQKAKAVPFTATVDSQGRLTEVKLDFPAVDPQIPAVTSTYSDYGTTVTVTKPDPAPLAELDQPADAAAQHRYRLVGAPVAEPARRDVAQQQDGLDRIVERERDGARLGEMPLGLGPLAERGADPAELTEDVADRLLRVDRAEQPQRRARRPSGPLRLPYREQHRAGRAERVGQ